MRIQRNLEHAITNTIWTMEGVNIDWYAKYEEAIQSYGLEEGRRIVDRSRDLLTGVTITIDDPELRSSLTHLSKILQGLAAAQEATDSAANCADIYLDVLPEDLADATRAPIVGALVQILNQSGCSVKHVAVDSTSATPRICVRAAAVRQEPLFRDYAARIFLYGGALIGAALALGWLFAVPEFGAVIAAGIAFFIMIGCLTVFDGHNWIG